MSLCGPGAPEARAERAQEGAARQPAAYVHYRWEEEAGAPVLYCYEIQLEPRVQRKGLGGCAALGGHARRPRASPRPGAAAAACKRWQVHGAGGVPDRLLGLATRYPPASEHLERPTRCAAAGRRAEPSALRHVRAAPMQPRRPCRLLMKLLELAARKAGARVLMLTVITANAAALALYARLGYAEDESSPAEEEAAGYRILARRLAPAAAAGAAAAAPLRPVTNSYQLEQLIFS